MKTVGNIFITTGLFFCLVWFFSLSTYFLLRLLFSCKDLYASNSCYYGPLFIESIATFFGNISFAGSFLLLAITLPLFLIGFLFLFIAKKINSDTVPVANEFDSFVLKLSFWVRTLFMILLAVAFWWFTLLAYIYQVIKTKSFTQGYLNIKTYILNPK